MRDITWADCRTGCTELRQPADVSETVRKRGEIMRGVLLWLIGIPIPIIIILWLVGVLH